MKEDIVETKICKQCSGSFPIYQEDQNFYDTISPSFDGERFQIPRPSLCPNCRQQRRLAWRNERNLYKRKCDATGKDMVSMYSPDKKNIVYWESLWWGDSWDAMEYGWDYKVDGSFFSQVSELFLLVPQPSLINNFQSIENTSYASYSGYLKNCFLVHESGSCEDTFYSESSRHIDKSFDLTMATRCIECYYSFNIFDCYRVFYSQNSTLCENSYLLKNCHNCKFCFWCNDISQKSYCIYNIEYSPEEYFDTIKKIREDIDFEKEYQKSSQEVEIYMHWHGNENVSWDYVFHSKNAHSCYHVKNLENGKYCSYLSSSSKKSQVCYDYDYFGGASRVYESLMTGGYSDYTLFCANSWQWSSNNFYSIMCYNCKNIFWCVWLKWKEYCILNKQYSKTEYERTVSQIITNMQTLWEWGEFFPVSMSPFGYNESISQEYFPLTQSEIEDLGAKYSSYKAPPPKVEKLIAAKRLPQNINDIPDDILNWAIECKVSGRNFRITPQELEFYRTHNLKVPCKHPDQRYMDRKSLLNPRKLYLRNCDICDVKLESTHSWEKTKKVLCRDCYNKKIY